MGYKARAVLAKTAGVNFLASVVLIVLHIEDGRDPDGTLIALFLVLTTMGTLIAAIRHDGGKLIDKLVNRVVDRMVDAFVASRPDGACPQPLRLVDPQETGSTIPAQRRSAP